MDARRRISRWWLTAAYVLAAVCVPSAHRHGLDSESDPTRCLASCQDSRLHLSGHAASDLGAPHDDCLACQFRANHQAQAFVESSPLPVPRAGNAEELPAPLTRSGSHSCPSCRAPPRV